MQIGNESKEAETRVQSLISYKYPLIEKKGQKIQKRPILQANLVNGEGGTKQFGTKAAKNMHIKHVQLLHTLGYKFI